MTDTYIKPFTLNQKIGKGSYGEVYLATKDGEPNTKYVAKRIEKRIIDKYEKYIVNEITILRSISHPNIIRLVDVLRNANFVFLFFDYCNGGELEQCLKKYEKLNDDFPFPEEVIQHFFRQIISAFYYLHQFKIIHRDIKLANILLNFPDEKDLNEFNLLKSEVKIIDFGFARKLEKGQLAESVVGTPLTMQPQLIQKQLNEIDQSFGYDESSDIWSLGTIFFEMLTGNAPFAADDYYELYYKHERGEYSIPADIQISDEAISFLNAMMRKDENQRWSIKDLIKHKFLTQKKENFHYVKSSENVRQLKLTINTLTDEEFSNERNKMIDNSVKLAGFNPPKFMGQCVNLKGLFKGEVRNKPQKEESSTKQTNTKVISENPKEFKMNEELKGKLMKIYEEMNEDWIYNKPKIAPFIHFDEPNYSQSLNF